MYIHLGRDYVLNDRDIIGIFNLETTTITPGPGVSELRPEERRGGEPFGRAAPKLCSGRRGPWWTRCIFRSCRLLPCGAEPKK